MMGALLAPSREKMGDMGKVVVSLTIVNYRDQVRVAVGDLSAADVRSVTLDSVIVDTGATTLALPADAIARLGLVLRREVPVLIATGQATARLYQDAAVTLLGLEGTFDCLELPVGSDALLGVIPLEALGIEPDLRNQQLRLLPEEPGNTYYTIY